jgi:hypothetical protein
MKHMSASHSNIPRALVAALLLALPSAREAFARVPGDIAAVGPKTAAVDLGAYAVVRYVAPAARPEEAGDGTREKPWASVAAAVKAAGPAGKDHRVAILVAAGTYDDLTIAMREYVDIYGGYSPGAWSRDIRANETVLDGREAQRVVIGADHARLDGFVVRRGRALGDGGAILCDGTSPTISNNRIEESFTVAPPDLRPDRIHQTGHVGGAMACLFEAVPVIANNVFMGNWTEIGDGGALAFYGWNRLPGNPRATVENNVFVDNRAGTKDRNRTRSSSGGAVVFSHEESPIFRNNVVAHNRSMGNSDAGGVYCEFYSSPTIERNWIVGNEADDDGGGIYTMRMSQPLIRRNLIAGNWTANGGVGGIRISKEGRAQVEDNDIVRNRTGGGIYMADGYLVARGNLIADNLKGPGIRLQQHFDYFRPPVIEDNRILDNEGGAISVMKYVGPPPATEKNRIREGSPATAESEWTVTAAEFLKDRAQTVFHVKEPLGADGSLAGRVVSHGGHWAVVAANGSDTLSVWGDMAGSGADPRLGLVPDYPAE